MMFKSFVIFVLIQFMHQLLIAKVQYYSKNSFKCFCGYSEQYEKNIEQCVGTKNDLVITPIQDISCSSCAMNLGLDPLMLCPGDFSSSQAPVGNQSDSKLTFIDKELDKFNKNRNPSPESSVSELLQIGNFYTVNGGDLYLGFKETTESKIIVSEFYDGGQVYSSQYVNLDCGNKHELNELIKNGQTFRCVGTNDQGWLEISVNKGEMTGTIKLSLVMGPNAGLRSEWLAQDDFCKYSPKANESNLCEFDLNKVASSPSDYLFYALQRSSYTHVVKAVEKGAIQKWDYKMPIMNVCAMSCKDERIVAFLSTQSGINFNDSEGDVNALGAAVYFDYLRQNPDKPAFDPNLITKWFLKYAPPGLDLKKSDYSGGYAMERIIMGIEDSAEKIDMEIYRHLAKRPEFAPNEVYPRFAYSSVPLYFMIYVKNVKNYFDLFYLQRKFQWLDSLSGMPITINVGNTKVNLLTHFNFPYQLEIENITEYLIKKFSPPDIILNDSLKSIGQILNSCQASTWDSFGEMAEESCSNKVVNELKLSIGLIQAELASRKK